MEEQISNYYDRDWLFTGKRNDFYQSEVSFTSEYSVWAIFVIADPDKSIGLGFSFSTPETYQHSKNAIMKLRNALARFETALDKAYEQTRPTPARENR